jgi:hypothetical protein
MAYSPNFWRFLKGVPLEDVSTNLHIPEVKMELRA